MTDVVKETGIGDAYTSVHEADEILDENPDDAPLEVIEEAYRTHVMQNPNRLDGTLSLRRKANLLTFRTPCVSLFGVNEGSNKKRIRNDLGSRPLRPLPDSGETRPILKN